MGFNTQEPARRLAGELQGEVVDQEPLHFFQILENDKSGVYIKIAIFPEVCIRFILL
jgi:hypothetical protein